MSNHKPEMPLAAGRWFVLCELEKVTRIEMECACEKDAQEFCLYLMHQNPGRWFVEPETQSTAMTSGTGLTP